MQPGRGPGIGGPALTGAAYVCIFTLMPRPPLRTDERTALEGCLCLALRRTARVVTQHFDAALRPFGVRATQIPILTAAAAGPVPLASLAAALDMERTTLLRNVRPLVRQGLIEVRREPGGRRDVVHGTAAGLDALARLYPAWRGVQERLLASVREPLLRETLMALGQATRATRQGSKRSRASKGA